MHSPWFGCNKFTLVEIWRNGVMLFGQYVRIFSAEFSPLKNTFFSCNYAEWPETSDCSDPVIPQKLLGV
jgi:hypothetical protein